MCSCALAPLYIITIRINRWVSLEPQMTKRFILIWFYRFFFLLIPCTHTGTAFITTTAILSDSFLFFGTNPYRHRLYGKKKLSVSQLCLRSHYISSRRYLYSAYKIYFTLGIKNHVLTQKKCILIVLLYYYIIIF